jgi:hypothetical protein
MLEHSAMPQPERCHLHTAIDPAGVCMSCGKRFCDVCLVPAIEEGRKCRRCAKKISRAGWKALASLLVFAVGGALIAFWVRHINQSLLTMFKGGLIAGYTTWSCFWGILPSFRWWRRKLTERSLRSIENVTARHILWGILIGVLVTLSSLLGIGIYQFVLHIRNMRRGR